MESVIYFGDIFTTTISSSLLFIHDSSPAYLKHLPATIESLF